MALLIPFTFGLDPVVSVVMLVTLYMASEYSGAIPAILVNTPGEPSSAVTALDGYPMRERGEAGQALTLSILGSAVGSVISTILLIFTVAWMTKIALAFGPAEYFALARARPQPDLDPRRPLGAARHHRPAVRAAC